MKRKLSAILLVFAVAISGMLFTTVSASPPEALVFYCSICESDQPHTFLGWYCTQNSASHYAWYSCDVCGRNSASIDTREAHSGGTATCSHKAVCSVCVPRYGGVQQEYGELDSNNHEYGTLIPAQPEVHTATELKPAVAAHYHCTCGKYFTADKVETTLEALTGEPPKHSGADDGDCTTAVVCECSYVITEAKAAHDWSKLDGKCATPGCTATCDSTADGNNDHACDTCGKSVTTCADNLTPVKGQAASCKVDGWKDYYTCSICGKNYSDANAENEITDLDEWKAGEGKIPATHVGNTHIEYKPIYYASTDSYNFDDHSVNTVCDTCGDILSEVLDAHKWVKGVCEDCELVCPHSGGSANCQKKAVCEICGEEYGKLNDTIHTGEPVMHKTPTTHEKTWNCCGKVMVAETPHNWYKGVCRDCKYVCQHSGEKATCKDKAVCEYCGESYGELDKTNHVGKTTDRFTWIMDSGTADLTQHVHGVLCDTCGNPISAEKENHIWVDGKCKLCGLTCDHKENTNHATCGHAANCSVCGMEVEKALLHWFSQWKPCSDGYHAAYCIREGCDGTAGLPCEWFELTFTTSDEEEMTVSICPVCGAVRHEDIVFEAIKSATVKANEKWLPRGELIVRAMENPYGECQYAFTVGYEFSGWLEDFLGTVTVTMPMELEGEFRLAYVEETLEGQTLTDVEFTYEDGKLTFETEKQGIYLILPVSE